MTRLSALSIRAASSDDATAIAEIKVAAWRMAYRGIVPDLVLDGLDVGNVRDNWLGVPKSELSSHGIVAVQGRDAAGYALFGAVRHGIANYDGQIFEIYVMPDQFGGGLGAQLHHAALARLKAERYTNIILWVFEANMRARRFYEKQGWTRIEGAETVTEIGSANLSTIAYGFRALNTLK